MFSLIWAGCGSAWKVATQSADLGGAVSAKLGNVEMAAKKEVQNASFGHMGAP
ncbi:MAG TPA: hypothetical protein VGE47_09275 [Burkholderiaceae bacterium]